MLQLRYVLSLLVRELHTVALVIFAIATLSVLMGCCQAPKRNFQPMTLGVWNGDHWTGTDPANKAFTLLPSDSQLKDYILLKQIEFKQYNDTCHQ